MKLTRRELLKGAGAAAVMSLPLLPDVAYAHGGQKEGVQTPPESSRVRQWVMVIDQRACDGCVGLGVPPQCTQACNWSRFVPEGQQWIEVYEADAGPMPSGGSSFLPAPCMQCQNAPCVNVCPVGASFHSPEGVVRIDQERCIGCRLCMAACPYDRRFFNWGEPLQPPDAMAAQYDVLTQLPAIKGTVMKCDFCTDKTAAGGLPACVEVCPRHAIYMGDFEEGIATNGAQIVELDELLSADGAQRYKEDLGTEPRVYYIPGHGEHAEMDRMAQENGFHAMAAAEKSGSGELRKDDLEWPWRAISNYVGALPDGAPVSQEG